MVQISIKHISIFENVFRNLLNFSGDRLVFDCVLAILNEGAWACLSISDIHLWFVECFHETYWSGRVSDCANTCRGCTHSSWVDAARDLVLFAVLTCADACHWDGPAKVLAVNWTMCWRKNEAASCLIVIESILTAAEGIHAFDFHELDGVFLFELLDKTWTWNLFYTEWEIDLFMNGLYKPLLHCIVLILCPELLHLLSCPLWNKSIILNIDPKTISIQIICVIWAHNLEELDALNNGELLFLSNIQLLAVFTFILN